LKSSLQGFLIAALLMGTLTVLGGMGGGDAKLIAAIGAMKGYPFIVDVLFYSFLVGGVIALSVAVWQGRFLGTMRRVGQMLFGVVFYRTSLVEGVEENQSYKIPFGVAICLGTLWAQLTQIFSS
jgi:prepilin peptidase CpaA